MTDVFVSYSRRDAVFAKQLTNAFENEGRDVWIDWEDIPRAADWLNEIYAGIEGADTVIQVVSRSSLVSEICNYEIAYARQHGKRIIPLIHEDITGETEAFVKTHWENATWRPIAEANWDAIRHLNWLFFRKDAEGNVPSADFEREYAALVQTLATDLNHVRLHTRVLVRMRDWKVNAENPSYLLMGDDLTAAENWLTDWESDAVQRREIGDTRIKQPAPTDEQRVYLNASHEAENERARRLLELEVSRQRADHAARRARNVLIVVGIIATLIIFGVVAFTNTQIDSANAVAAASAVEAANAGTQVAVANATLSPIPPTLTYVNEQITAAEDRIEALRLATLAQEQVDIGQNELGALLALHALNITYTPQADAVLVRASNTQFARRLLSNEDTNYYFATALTNDRRTLFAVAEKVDVWDLESGTRIHQFDFRRPYDQSRVSFGKASRFVLSPDERTLLFSVHTGLGVSLRFISMETGRQREFRVGADDRCPTFAYTADSQGIFGCSSTEVWWRDVATGAVIRTYPRADDAPITDFALSPDNRHIVTLVVAEDRTARLHFEDVDSGELLNEIRLTLIDPQTVDFLPDGRTISLSSRDELHVIDVETGDLLGQARLGEGSNPTLLAISPDVQMAVVGIENGEMRLVNLPTLTLRMTLSGYNRYVMGAGYMADGTSLLSVGSTGELRLWDLDEADARGYRHQQVGDLMALAVSPDGLTAMSSGFEVGTSPHFHLWDIATGDTLRSFDVPFYYVELAAFMQDGQRALVTDLYGSAAIYDLNTGSPLTYFDAGSEITALVLTPNDEAALLGLFDGTIQLRDSATGTLIREYNSPSNANSVISLGSDGQTLWVATRDGILTEFAVESGQILRRYESEGELIAAAFSPDGHTVAVAPEGYIVALRSLDTGETIREIRGQIDQTYTLTFSPDGQRFIGATGGNAFRLWDVNTGETLRVMQDYQEAGGRVAFTPDGQQVISGAQGGLLRVWDVDYGDFVAHMCRRLPRDLTADERARYKVEGDVCSS